MNGSIGTIIYREATVQDEILINYSDEKVNATRGHAKEKAVNPMVNISFILLSI